ncbi:MAG TPA: hypothetical protein VJ476_15295 [Rhizomicrobium sp.]|nr:hypothetical protein [Rhizomicrobium sp.]
MKTQYSFAGLALGTALFATAALADSMSTGTMPNNTMAPASNATAPTNNGMMATHKPKPKKHTTNAMSGNTMVPSNTTAPANAMAPSNTTGGSSH